MMVTPARQIKLHNHTSPKSSPLCEVKNVEWETGAVGTA